MPAGSHGVAAHHSRHHRAWGSRVSGGQRQRGVASPLPCPQQRRPSMVGRMRQMRGTRRARPTARCRWSSMRAASRAGAGRRSMRCPGRRHMHQQLLPGCAPPLAAGTQRAPPAGSCRSRLLLVAGWTTLPRPCRTSQCSCHRTPAWRAAARRRCRTRQSRPSCLGYKAHLPRGQPCCHTIRQLSPGRH